MEDVVAVHHEEVEGKVDGVRGRVLRKQPVPRRAALVQLKVLEDVGAQHLRQTTDYLIEGRSSFVSTFWIFSTKNMLFLNLSIV